MKTYETQRRTAAAIAQAQRRALHALLVDLTSSGLQVEIGLLHDTVEVRCAEEDREEVERILANRPWYGRHGDVTNS